eukprot:Phypoly_transcript_10732.p1 GENE.Phypoly_transcript_10732~~Phypoly_transcript_10732.p1  ORF type:complete len:123 (+),score=12.80 Phypoly_transcript_10732:903-1271(+)
MSLKEPACHAGMFNGAQDVVGGVLASRCRLASSDSALLKKDKEKEGSKSPRFNFKRENTFPKPRNKDGFNYSLLAGSKSPRFNFKRENTFPKLSSKLKQYNQTITKEKSLINFDVSLQNKYI